jgi:hypothetical protein
MDIDWLIVANDIQQKIAEKYAPLCSPPLTTEEFLHAMRFQPCSSFVPLWRKYNRAARGSLEVGQETLDCYLWDLRKSHYIRLRDILRIENPTSTPDPLTADPLTPDPLTPDPLTPDPLTLTLMVAGSLS